MKTSKRNQSGPGRKLTLCRDYVWEKRGTIGLFFLTAVIFLTVGSLYQIENLSKLLYAALLSAFFWTAAGAGGMISYVAKREKAAKAAIHPEQAAELLLEEGGDEVFLDGIKAASASEESDRDTHTLEEDYRRLVYSLCLENRRLFNHAEERRTEQNDYYLMWAHQIKTPIAAMRLLLDGTGENFLLQEELFQIEQYVEMALHFQRLESMASDMMPEECDLYALLKQAVRKYSVLFINHGLSLKLEEMRVTVITDEKWFVFCVEQILSNSIKYTAKGSISIHMEGAQEAGRTPPVLVIEDTGIGIRPEDIPRIFERGFTGYNGRMDKKSTGIGLYLTKQILDRLGVGIRVDSQEDAGTKVSLIFENLTKM